MLTSRAFISRKFYNKRNSQYAYRDNLCALSATYWTIRRLLLPFMVYERVLLLIPTYSPVHATINCI